MSTKFKCFTFTYPKDLNYFYEFKGKMCKNLTDLEIESVAKNTTSLNYILDLKKRQSMLESIL